MNQQEPSILNAVWRHKQVVLLLALLGTTAGILLGSFFAARQPAVAEATFLIQDPAALSDQAFIDTSQQSRYVVDQVAIIQSAEVLESASELVREETGADLSIREFDKALTLSWSSDSAVATATFEAERPEVALTATNALLHTYHEVLSEQVNASSEGAIELANGAISQKELAITRLEDQLEAAEAAETAETARLRALADEAAALRVAMVGASVAGRQALVDRLNALTVEMDLVTGISESRPPKPNVARLERQLAQAVLEQNALIDRRTELEIDARLNQPPTAVFSPARIVEPSGLPLPMKYGAAAGLLFLFSAAGWAYTRSLRDERIADPNEPEALIGAPLLAEIGDFAQERLKTQLPIRDEPRSQAAEGYRFLAASTDVRMSDLGVRSLAVVGAEVGGGKTTTAANLAVAMAKHGSRVLLVDADFGNQALSKLFGVDQREVAGITEILAGRIPVEEAGTTISGTEGSLILIGRGQGHAIAPSLFRSPEAASFFAGLSSKFDTVIVDTPPLLQVAYATTLVDLVESSLLVIPSDTSADEVLTTASRLRSIGSEILGYAMIRAKVAKKPPIPEGSLRDVLGDEGFEAAVKSRMRR